VVFEDTFMDLVEEVRREGKKDVGVREICPEWVEDGT
jgi:hypothetical protein